MKKRSSTTGGAEGAGCTPKHAPPGVLFPGGLRRSHRCSQRAMLGGGGEGCFMLSLWQRGVRGCPSHPSPRGAEAGSWPQLLELSLGRDPQADWQPGDWGG